MSDASSVGKTINYTASPTITNFMISENFVRFILGPVGSGKTTGALFEVLRRCCEQTPGPDGLRRTRFVIVRNTLQQMTSTILQEIKHWLGDIAHYKVSDKVVEIRAGDVHSDWLLIPLDTPENQQRLLSLQLTGAWVNEFIELDPDLIDSISGRLWRYPSAAQGGPTWSGLIGDSNMPNAGSRWHELLDVTRPKLWDVFYQPGGLDPDAENLNYLAQTNETLKLPLDHPDRIARGRGYYERLLNNANQNWIKRYVHAKFGDDQDGTAVFRESFSRDFHVAKERIIPSIGLPLTIGQDFGRNPCAVICQMNHKGQLLVLREIVAQNMSLEIHVPQNLRPILANDERFINKRVVIVGDPSGIAKGNTTEMDCFTYLEQAGFMAYPAPTNDIAPRLAAVEMLFSATNKGAPMILIDPEGCPNLVAALHAKYLFAKRKDGEARPLPEKRHPWSDLVDSLQYVALCVQGGYQLQIADDMFRRTDVNRVRQTAPRTAAWT